MDTATTKRKLTDIEWLLAKMYQDDTHFGVEAYLIDAINHQLRHQDYAAANVLQAALDSFLADPCGHLNTFEHLTELSDWCRA